MNKIGVICLVFIVNIVTAIGQDNACLRHTSTADYKMDYYILLKSKKIKFDDSLDYSWFKSQKIYQTQGNASGNLLHGNFSKYYSSGELAEKGSYKYGLKDGEWVTWYPSGNFNTICFYKNGRLEGNYILFDEAGKKIEEKQFHKGELKSQKIKEKPVKRQVEDLDPDLEEDLGMEKEEDQKKRNFFKKNKEMDLDEIEEQEKESFFKRLLNNKKDPEKTAAKEKKRNERDAKKEAKKNEQVD